MEQWCLLVLLVLAAPAQAANRVVSWLLDNVKWLRQKWDPLPNLAKGAIYAVVCFGIGLGAFYGGRALSCPDLPDLAGYLYALVMAAIGFINGQARHYQQKLREERTEAEKLAISRKWQEE